MMMMMMYECLSEETVRIVPIILILFDILVQRHTKDILKAVVFHAEVGLEILEIYSIVRRQISIKFAIIIWKKLIKVGWYASAQQSVSRI